MSSGIIRVAADGSPGSRRALSWALDEASRRGCGIEVVSAYQRAPGQSVGEARSAAEEAAQATMDGVVAHGVQPSVSWHVVEGDPIDVLVRESAQSLLLVMGSHSVDELRHNALGSVADTTARMADCPVVIVPPTHQVNTSDHEELTAAPHPSTEAVVSEPLHKGRRIPVE